jgi:outer membrane protein assembly factor BamB
MSADTPTTGAHDSRPAPNLRSGLLLFGMAAATFAAVVMLLPTSRGRTLLALVVPMAGLTAATVWWIRDRSLPRRTKALGLVATLGGALFLGAVPGFPASVIAVLWGLPAATGLTLLVAYLWRGRSPFGRSLAVGATFLASLAPWPLLEADGASGQMMPNLVWRWETSTREATSVALDPVTGTTPLPVLVTLRDWPGFRGPARSGVVPDAAAAKLRLDWQLWPPAELWRRPIGEGWSSFAAVGDLACTQDQAEAKERVFCLDARTGRTLWEHSDETRFEELAGGPGPRATPLVHAGRLYSLGASGRLNCLDVQSGELLWSKDISGGQGKAPEWGFASSPLILDDLVYVSPAGVGGVRVLALDRTTGDHAWQAEGDDAGYSSAQVAVLGGTAQLLLVDGAGVAGYDPRTGEPLWDYPWRTAVPKVALPHVWGGDTVIVGMGYGRGTRSLVVTTDGVRWSVEESWSTSRFKPKFNDFVIRDGHIYGLDEGILACVSAATGERLWKGGRYGYGQLLLAGEHLLIVTESGDLVLVEATAAGHRELGRWPALSGKSWSHPAIARGRLLLRNGSEAVAYDLAGPAR